MVMVLGLHLPQAHQPYTEYGNILGLLVARIRWFPTSSDARENPLSECRP
jgi:hypothetical protein